MKRAISTLAAISLAILLVAAGASTIVVSGQLLAYQDGYVFFTSGDGLDLNQRTRECERIHEPLIEKLVLEENAKREERTAKKTRDRCNSIALHPA